MLFEEITVSTKLNSALPEIKNYGGLLVTRDPLLLGHHPCCRPLQRYSVTVVDLTAIS